MDSQQFVQDAIRTESVLPADKTYNRDLLIGALELVNRANEVLDVVKKNLYYGKAVNAETLAEHLAVLSTLTQTLPAEFAAPAEKATALNVDGRVLHAIIGMNTEAGEMAKAFLAHLIGDEFDVVNFHEELGDSDWYKAIALDATGGSEEAIRATVIAKLRHRYPDKFDADRAIHRDLAGERQILEGQPAAT